MKVNKMFLGLYTTLFLDFIFVPQPISKIIKLSCLKVCDRYELCLLTYTGWDATSLTLLILSNYNGCLVQCSHSRRGRMWKNVKYLVFFERFVIFFLLKIRFTWKLWLLAMLACTESFSEAVKKAKQYGM